MLAPQRGLFANGRTTRPEVRISYGAAGERKRNQRRLRNNILPELSNSVSPPAKPGGYLGALSSGDHTGDVPVVPGQLAGCPPPRRPGLRATRGGCLSHSDDNGSGPGAGARRSARPASGRAPSRSRRWTPHEPALGVRLAIVPAPRYARRDGGAYPPQVFLLPPEGLVAPPAPLLVPASVIRPTGLGSQAPSPGPSDRIQSP